MKNTSNKLLNILLLVIVALIIYLPLVFMNHEKEAESLIDNRFLYEWDSEADPFFPMMNQYVNDRIGFRYDMLRNQMIIKDRLFFEPSMVRGKDGFIFPTLSAETVDHDFLNRFGQFLSEVNNVCEERSIPFLFMLNPIKTSIYPDKLPDGYVYHRLHPQAIEAMLEQYDIPYVSTYYNLKALADDSIPIYNVEYDQNHWNDLGMYYGVNVMLEALQELGVNVSTNNLADYSYSTVMKYKPTTHPFPINDEIPIYTSSEMQDYDFVKDEYGFLNEYMSDKCLGVYRLSPRHSR